MTYLYVLSLVMGVHIWFIADTWWKWLIGSIFAFVRGVGLEAVIERLFRSIWRLQEHLGLEDDYDPRKYD